MALNNFLNQRATIKKVIPTDGFTPASEEIIYTDIPCYSYSVKTRLSDNATTLNDNLGGLRVMLEPSRTLIKKGMLITITDINLGSNDYKILGDPKPNYLANNTLDSLQIEVGK